MSKDARRIKFLGIEWSKEDLSELCEVLLVGLEERLDDFNDEKIKLAVKNLREIID
jgi:hypothetical protein